jgi:hypothetical protein
VRSVSLRCKRRLSGVDVERAPLLSEFDPALLPKLVPFSQHFAKNGCRGCQFLSLFILWRGASRYLHPRQVNSNLPETRIMVGRF